MLQLADVTAFADWPSREDVLLPIVEAHNIWNQNLCLCCIAAIANA